jgi:hypothetical protein
MSTAGPNMEFDSITEYVSGWRGILRRELRHNGQ